MPIEPKSTSDESNVIALLDDLNDLIILLTPKIDHLLSERLTSAQRQDFRERAGRERIFDLVNRLHHFNQSMNSLCSETARANIAMRRVRTGS